MSGSYVYPVVLEERQGGAYSVRFPDFREALTFGASLEDALNSAEDCLREALRGRIRDNEEIPVPSVVPGAHLIVPPAEVAAKAAVYEAFRRAKTTRVALAQKLNLHESEIRRILDPRHPTKLGRLEEVARALGGRIEVNFAFGPAV